MNVVHHFVSILEIFIFPKYNRITELVEMNLQYTNRMFPSINGTKIFKQHLTAILNSHRNNVRKPLPLR